MARMVGDIYADFRDFCQETRNRLRLYTKFSSYGSNLMLERLFELVFMQFERLVEETFLSYSMGSLTASGKDVIRRIQLHSEAEVAQLYSGNKDYPDWTRWDNIISMSNIFFTASPYDNLKNHIAFLNDLKSLRNTLAHISGTAQSKFESLVRKKLGHYPNSGMLPSEFLIHRIPTATTKIFFQEYLDELLIIAGLICDPPLSDALPQGSGPYTSF